MRVAEINVVEQTSSGLISELILKFDGDGITSAQAVELKANLAQAGVVANALPPTGNGGYANIDDDAGVYEFWDNNGTFTVQYNNSLDSMPWGYRISGALGSIIVSQVSERGMGWIRNGVRQPRQSPHVVAWFYQFHGTFSGIQNQTTVIYDDRFTFRVQVAGQTGDGEVNITGNLRAVP